MLSLPALYYWPHHLILTVPVIEPHLGARSCQNGIEIAESDKMGKLDWNTEYFGDFSGQ